MHCKLDRFTSGLEFRHAQLKKMELCLICSIMIINKHAAILDET